MRFDELEFKRRIQKGLDNLTVVEEIDFNILNFIRCIHLNNQVFYLTSCDSQLFGDLEMTFRKDAKSLIGHCRVIVKRENRVEDYLFTEHGYEALGDIMMEW